MLSNHKHMSSCAICISCSKIRQVNGKPCGTLGRGMLLAHCWESSFFCSFFFFFLHYLFCSERGIQRHRKLSFRQQPQQLYLSISGERLKVMYLPHTWSTAWLTQNENHPSFALKSVSNTISPKIVQLLLFFFFSEWMPITATFREDKDLFCFITSEMAH